MVLSEAQKAGSHCIDTLAAFVQQIPVAIGHYLNSTRNIWLSFWVTFALTIAFGVVMHLYDFQIIDEMWKPAVIRDHVFSMSAEQRRAHQWLTGTADVLYPFAYSSLFAGLALRHWKRYGPVIAIVCGLCIPVDLIEGLSQIFILGGSFEWLWVKAVATPIKLVLFGIGLISTLIILLKLAFARLTRRPPDPA